MLDNHYNDILVSVGNSFLLKAAIWADGHGQRFLLLSILYRTI